MKNTFKPTLEELKKQNDELGIYPLGYMYSTNKEKIKRDFKCVSDEQVEYIYYLISIDFFQMLDDYLKFEGLKEEKKCE